MWRFHRLRCLHLRYGRTLGRGFYELVSIVYSSVISWFRFLVSVLERHALIALAAVTLHDAMQLARLSKPRSGAKYSLISYFFADNRSLSQPCLGRHSGHWISHRPWTN